MADGGLAPGAAEQRWRAIIRARREQMDAAYAQLGRTSADFWDRRARRFHESTRRQKGVDPFLQRVRRLVGPRTTVLDVGAGSGRYVLALAPLVRAVIAVEPNGTMLGLLWHELDQIGLRNVRVVSSTWERAPELTADVALCSHVLYPIEQVGDFIRKLDRAARRWCLIYLRAWHQDTLSAPLWERFHGEPRCVPPGYIEALDVLCELGIYANLQAASVPYTWLYQDLDEATDELMEQLILPESARAELRALLPEHLVKTEAGYRFPAASIPVAVIWWGKRG